MRLCELREKEVINLCSCRRLGYVEDLVFDLCSGCIEAIVVPSRGKLCNFFGGDEEYVIPIKCIQKTGEDMILVEICEEKFLKSCRG